MKKKLLALVLATVLVAMAIVGGTFAYLSDVQSDVNVMTMGNVYIEQYEYERNANGELVEFTQAKPAYPVVGVANDNASINVNGFDCNLSDGSLKNVVDKIVTVKNVGKSDAFLRTVIAVEAPGFDTEKYINVNFYDDAMISDPIETTIDGVNYLVYVATYEEAIAPKEFAAPSLLQVYLSSEAGNEYCDAFGDTWEILVVSQAVQTAGFEDAEDALNTAFGKVEANNNPWQGENAVVDAIIPSVVTTAEDFEKALENGEAIYLSQNVELDEALVIDAGVDADINLNGNTLTGNVEVKEGATLTVTNGTIESADPSVSAIQNNGGDLVLNDVEIVSARHGVRAEGGTVEINGGTYSTAVVNGGMTQHAIYVSDGAYVEINGGTFVGPNGVATFSRSATADSGSAVCVGAGCKVIINGGNFSGGKSKTLKVAGKLIVRGGTFDQDPSEYVDENVTVVKNSDNEYVVLPLNVKWDGTVDTTWYDAEAEIYNITTAEQLAGLAALVNSGETFFEGKTVNLCVNVDLQNKAWTPIGSAAIEHGFMGNFYGQGHTIKNLTIKPTVDADGYAYAGFFGVTEGINEDNQNYIENLTIENVTISTKGHIVAAAIAYPYYTNVSNITVCGDIAIEGGDYTSGVLAYTRRCVDAKNITLNGNKDSYITGRYTVGGVISDIQMNGGLKANYSNFSASNVTVTGNKCVGGISGIIGGQTLDGATVKNVELVCTDTRVGVVSGSIAGAPSIKNVSISNVTGAIALVGAPYDANSSRFVTINGKVFEYVADADTLVAALKAGNSVILANDITMAATKGGYNKAGIVVNNGQIVEGNGYTLKVTGAGATYDCAIYLTNGTIKNITVAGAMRGVFTAGQSADLYLDNVTFKNVVYTFNSDDGNANYTIYINNCNMNGWTSHSNVHKEVVYTNCEFGEGSGYKFCRPYGPTKFVDCNFVEGYKLDAIGKVTFENCTIGGVALTADNLATLVTSNTANATVK